MFKKERIEKMWKTVGERRKNWIVHVLMRNNELDNDINRRKNSGKIWKS